MIGRRITALFIALLCHIGLSAPYLFAAELLSAEFDSEATFTGQPQATLALVTLEPSTADTVQLTASGLWRNACVPEFEHLNISDFGYVKIVAVAERADQVCAQVETEWQFDVTTVLTVPFYYQADLVILSEWENSRDLAATTWFPVDGTIDMTPAEPEAGDELTVVVDGWHPDGCAPAYVSHYRSGNTLVIDAETPDAYTVCGQALTDWSFDVAIGEMAESDQVIEVYVTYHVTYHPYPESGRQLYGTIQLRSMYTRRGDMDYQIYLPGFISNAVSR